MYTVYMSLDIFDNYHLIYLYRAIYLWDEDQSSGSLPRHWWEGTPQSPQSGLAIPVQGHHPRGFWDSFWICRHLLSIQVCSIWQSNGKQMPSTCMKKIHLQVILMHWWIYIFLLPASYIDMMRHSLLNPWKMVEKAILLDFTMYRM